MDQTYTVRGAFGEPIAEYAGGTPVLKYWNYVRPDGVVLGRREGSNRFFYHRDHLGSTRTVLSQHTAPNVVETYDYMPFGEFMSGRITTSGTGTRPKYTGHAFDDETDLHNMQWRRQIPRYGVFRTPDPMADSYLGWNAYAYVMNDPMRFTDPTGMSPCGVDGKPRCELSEVTVVAAADKPTRSNTATASVGALFLADVTTLEPSDFYIPKWVGWAVALSTAVVLDAYFVSTPEVTLANTYPDTDELARRLGIPRNKVHDKKKEILGDLDVADAKRKTGDSNVDIGISPDGNIVLRGNKNRKEVDTSIPLNSFKD